MNVIVAHDGRQHVNRLLIALKQHNWLQHFYSGFASNTLPDFLRSHIRLQNMLRKREFSQVPSDKISSFYLSALLTRLSSNGYWQVGVAYQLFARWVAGNLYQKPDFDLVIGYENANLEFFKAARILKRKTVLDLAQVHHNLIDTICNKFNINELTAAQNKYINRRKQAALDQTDYILTLSSFATKSLINNGIKRSRIYEVNLGIDPGYFRPSPKPGDGRFRVLFTGTITYRKGIEQLLRVFRQLLLPDAELLLVGPVGDAGALLAQCTGAIRHVPFLHHDELITYYQQADVFVFPSYLDSWGQVVLEAMACGTPVVISDNTGAKDAVAKGGGFIIPTGDAAALRGKIKYLYDHRDEAEQMGYEARRVAEGYTWENYYQQVTDALTDIAQREGIPV